MIRFEFSLAPVDTIAPWTDGEGKNPRLHWFALTDGEYWIVVDDIELFRYDDESLRRWTQEGYRARRHADYPVVRLWEDVIEGYQAFTELVPPDLVPFIESNSLPEFDWGENEYVDLARSWHCEHYLDSGHMKLQTVKWWRSPLDLDNDVVWTWWNDEPTSSSVRFEAPPSGCVPTRVEDFEAAVADFDRRLIQAMDSRVAEVERGALDESIDCDPHVLRQEHETRRSGWFAKRRSVPRSTDWSAIRRGAREMLGTSPPTEG